MKKDYTSYSFLISLLVIVILLGISAIPSFTIGGVKLRRANIISEIYNFGDSVDTSKEAELSSEDEQFLRELDNMPIPGHDEQAGQLPNTSTPDVEHQERDWVLTDGKATDGTAVNTHEHTDNPSSVKGSSLAAGTGIEPAHGTGAAGVSSDTRTGTKPDGAGTGAQQAGVIALEDYYPEESKVSLAHFCELLGTATSKRTVRIAFMGDSYIEGDIITADVRSLLQSRYGGGGVGFIPFSTPLAANKPTVRHTYSKWSEYNLVYKSKAPEDIKDRFYVSGFVSVPSDGATVKYETTGFRNNLRKCNTAKLIFTNEGHAELKVVVNDSIENVFTPDSSALVQQINITGSNIKSLKIELTDPHGFYGYGVVLGSSPGIGVDNYSIRGNSGLALFGSNSKVNSRINSMLRYDLVVLQYGLNIMQADIHSYNNYGAQLVKIINYVKACFPSSAIIVLGVGDRSTQKEGEFVSMSETEGMIKAQRNAAKEAGVAFWDMRAAMGGKGGMSQYVENNWAAKDYTHLSFAGGKQIAAKFVAALEAYKDVAAQRALEREQEMARIEKERADSIAKANRAPYFDKPHGFERVRNPSDAH